MCGFSSIDLMVGDMMKRQHLFNSLWASLTAAVLATQPAWADTMQASAVRLNPKVNGIKEKPVPSYLNPNPNPLQFPTLPESVQIQGTQPITLQQAQELARRNNQSLQVGELTFERSLAGLLLQQAAEYPTINIAFPELVRYT